MVRDPMVVDQPPFWNHLSGAARRFNHARRARPPRTPSPATLPMASALPYQRAGPPDQVVWRRGGAVRSSPCPAGRSGSRRRPRPRPRRRVLPGPSGAPTLARCVTPSPAVCCRAPQGCADQGSTRSRCEERDRASRRPRSGVELDVVHVGRGGLGGTVRNGSPSASRGSIEPLPFGAALETAQMPDRCNPWRRDRACQHHRR